MKKYFSALLSLCFVFTLIFTSLAVPTASASAANQDKIEKELAKEIVKDAKQWKNFDSTEKEKVKEFAKRDSEKVLKKIEKLAEKEIKNKKITSKEEKYKKKDKALEQLWPTLSEDEQLAYLVYATPVEIEFTEELIPDNAEESINLEEKEEVSSLKVLDKVLSFIGPIKAEAANRSNTFRSYATAKNVIGQTLFQYYTQNTWYYDGVKIHSIDPKEGFVPGAPGWSFDNKTVESWYEYNNFDYIRNIEAQFTFSIVANWQRAYIYLDTKVRANGAWSVYKSGNGVWTS